MTGARFLTFGRELVLAQPAEPPTQAGSVQVCFARLSPMFTELGDHEVIGNRLLLQQQIVPGGIQGCDTLGVLSTESINPAFPENPP